MHTTIDFVLPYNDDDFSFLTCYDWIFRFRYHFLFRCCPEPYISLVYQLVLKRKPGFHLFHIILPSLALTFLSLLSFISPHLTGERISLSIESFLSLSFLLVLVSEEMPVNSDVTPMISKFLLSCMVFISAVVLSNLISANLSGKTEVPKYIRYIFLQIIAPLVGMADLTEKYVKNKSKYNKHTVKLKPFLMKKKSCLNLQKEAINGLKDMKKIFNRKKQQEKNKEFWLFMGRTLDRLFFTLFSAALVFIMAYVGLQASRKRNESSILF